MAEHEEPDRPRGTVGWTVITLALLAFILIPFVLWEGTLFSTTERLIAGSWAGPVYGAVLAGLLFADVALPVPSSLLSTVAGARFGVLGGTLVSVVGLTGGCLVAYAIGSWLGRPAAVRFAGAGAVRRVAETTERYGDWGVVVCRAVPVLAEASVLLAGVTRFPLGRFLLITGLSNLGLSLVYAWVGARSVTAGSFLMAFGGAILVPALALAAWHVSRRAAPAGRTSAQATTGESHDR